MRKILLLALLLFTVMPISAQVDIDEEIDLKLAEVLLNELNTKQ